MSNYAPRRQDDGSWLYTNLSPKAGIYAIGYCNGWRDLPRDERQRLCITDVEWARMKAHKALYHSGGHPTKDEACACYRRFLLDSAVRLDGESYDAPEPCAVCAAPTQRFAAVGEAARFALCDEHRTHAHVEGLFDVPPTASGGGVSDAA